MSRDRNDMDAILKRYLPRPTKKLVEEGSQRVLARIREDLQRREEEFGGPVDNGIILLSAIEELVLTAAAQLGDEANIGGIEVKAAEISLKPHSSSSISATIDRLIERGLMTMRKTQLIVTPNGKFGLSQAKLRAQEATDAIGDLI